MSSGTVKWFRDDKGYGFITPDGGEPEIFIHQSRITMTGRRTLTVGQKVEYDVEKTEKGLQAVSVRPVS